MMTLVFKLLLAYLLGSVSGSLLLGRLRHVDIRTMGSGNAGGTNAFRTQGFLFALGVVVIDVGKAVLATAIVPGLGLPDGPESTGTEQVMLACGFAAVLGHCFPAWHGFRGGKGAATVVGALAVIQPWLLLPMIVTWALVLVLTGFVSLATVLAGISLVPAAFFLESSQPLVVFTAAIALFMVFTHRGNLKRLGEGTESRFERIRAVNWFRR
jgi:glycerol-3-phosphate acyltransferase PlsY